MMINIFDNNKPFPTELNGWKNITEENSLELLLQNGWRKPVPKPDLQEGYIRVSDQFVEDDGTYGKWIVQDITLEEYNQQLEQAALEEKNNRQQQFINSGLVPIAKIFRSILREISGLEDAEINRTITEAWVFNYYAAKITSHTMTDIDRDNKDILQNFFVILTNWTGTGETWSVFEEFSDLLAETE